MWMFLLFRAVNKEIKRKKNFFREPLSLYFETF